MVRGLYTAAVGMMTQMNRMDVISNNIANVNTTGFKRDQTAVRSFSEELGKRLNDSSDIPYSRKVGNLSMGSFVDDIYTDFSNGSFRNTGGPLDLAISGSGFFSIQTTNADGDQSEKYTRDGAFTMLEDGTLTTLNGDSVMGQNGVITIPEGIISINENGDIYSNDQYIDTLKMTDFTDLHTLRAYGDNMYTTTDESQTQAFAGKINAGFLENSNANSVKEMVEMINTERTYDANSRMITVIDSIMQRTVNDVGRKA